MPNRRSIIIDGQKITLDATELPMGLQIMKDLTPIAVLKCLKKLELPCNLISDLTPLAELKQLSNLDLAMNRITDLTPLSNLTQLKNYF